MPYLYTTFHDASQTGVPIMRPMFLDFPHDESLFGTASQFMFGDSILVSPKLKSPTGRAQAKWSVSTTLPASASWYNYITKRIETNSGQQFVAEYKDIEIPMWVKAGTILPILDHKRELSLLRAIRNPLALEIFVDEKQTAEG